MEEFLNSIPGAAELFAWFGYWPTFHHAEIVSLLLNRSGLSSLVVQTWHTTEEVDDRGCFIKEKHVRASFQMEEIESMSLSRFSRQNVVFGLEIFREGDGYKLVLDPSYGLTGSITTRKLFIEIEPVPGESA